MNPGQTIEIVRLVLFTGLMIAGIWFDTTQRRLPNSLVLSTIALGAITAIAQFGLPAFQANVLHFALALAVAVVIYAVGWIGAGDAKFYAAVAVWFPLSQALSVLTTISALGLVIVLAWLIVRRVRLGPRPLGEKTAKFPLGVPIAVGACAHFLRIALLPVV